MLFLETKTEILIKKGFFQRTHAWSAGMISAPGWCVW